MQSTEPMHPADIMAAIKKAGSSLTAIAKQEGVGHPLVSMVVKGKCTSHKVAYAIAAVTGIPTERMWPGKYLTKPDYEKAHGDKATGRLPELKEVANG